ncbi:hypothetical protein QW71_34235 [Paenibacillus sp. IHB B 3415]|nr:hypothetical protein QW71_34235 [Paenibacillus sp. IHB B 3415]
MFGVQLPLFAGDKTQAGIQFSCSYCSLYLRMVHRTWPGYSRNARKSFTDSAILLDILRITN